MQVQFVGAYNASQQLTPGNLTTTGADVALNESVSIGYAVYAIVNASTPSAGQLYVTVQAAEYRGMAVAFAATGTFPAAGHYAPNSSFPLVPMNISLLASVQTLDAYRAFLNFSSGPNGSLALQDEHVQALRAVNISLDAVNFPNATHDAAGNLDLKYVTGAISARGWVASDLTGTFRPALSVVQGPLYVGKSWNASSNASFHGSVAYAQAISVVMPNGAHASMANSASASANSTVPVSLTFTVVGTRTILFPNGVSETDFVIAASSANGPAGVYVANGLIVLPLSDPSHGAGLPGAVPEKPATAPLAPGAAPPTMALYSPSRHLSDSQETTPAKGTTVTAAPMTPAAATVNMHNLGHPTAPTLAQGPNSLAGLVVVLGLGAVIVASGLLLRGFWRSK